MAERARPALRCLRGDLGLPDPRADARLTWASLTPATWAGKSGSGGSIRWPGSSESPTGSRPDAG
jgi:hypothetical protein